MEDTRPGGEGGVGGPGPRMLTDLESLEWRNWQVSGTP